MCILAARWWEYGFRANNYGLNPYLYTILTFLLLKFRVRPWCKPWNQKIWGFTIVENWLCQSILD